MARIIDGIEWIVLTATKKDDQEQYSEVWNKEHINNSIEDRAPKGLVKGIFDEATLTHQESWLVYKKWSGHVH